MPPTPAAHWGELPAGARQQQYGWPGGAGDAAAWLRRPPAAPEAGWLIGLPVATTHLPPQTTFLTRSTGRATAATATQPSSCTSTLWRRAGRRVRGCCSRRAGAGPGPAVAQLGVHAARQACTARPAFARACARAPPAARRGRARREEAGEQPLALQMATQARLPGFQGSKSPPAPSPAPPAPQCSPTSPPPAATTAPPSPSARGATWRPSPPRAPPSSSTPSSPRATWSAAPCTPPAPWSRARSGRRPSGST